MSQGFIKFYIVRISYSEYYVLFFSLFIYDDGFIGT